MNQEFEDAFVHGWEPLVDVIELPDRNDRHVVATAVLGCADVVVINNLKDFPVGALSGFNLTVQSADEFLLNQLELNPSMVMTALAHQAADMCNPPRDVWDVIASLEQAGARGFADAARRQVWRCVPPKRDF